jgi:hypothetical protein
VKTFIYTSELEQALKEVSVQRKILLILKRVSNPVERARVLRAVAALYGLDE